jgi:hypothetical protein
MAGVGGGAPAHSAGPPGRRVQRPPPWHRSLQARESTAWGSSSSITISASSKARPPRFPPLPRERRHAHRIPGWRPGRQGPCRGSLLLRAGRPHEPAGRRDHRPDGQLPRGLQPEDTSAGGCCSRRHGEARGDHCQIAGALCRKGEKHRRERSMYRRPRLRQPSGKHHGLPRLHRPPSRVPARARRLGAPPHSGCPPSSSSRNKALAWLI